MNLKSGLSKLLEIKVPYYIAFIILGCFGVVIWFFTISKKTEADNNKELQTSTAQIHDHYAYRGKGRLLTRPLLYVEGVENNPELLNLKNEITNYINLQKGNGTVSKASLYFKNLTSGDVIKINTEELYSPGSLMKVPVMMALLAEAEKKPDLLKTKVEFKHHFNTQLNQTITGETLKPNQYYSIADLLYYLIAFSDNDADILLGQQLNFKDLENIFESINLKPPA